MWLQRRLGRAFATAPVNKSERLKRLQLASHTTLDVADMNSVLSSNTDKDCAFVPLGDIDDVEVCTINNVSAQNTPPGTPLYTPKRSKKRQLYTQSTQDRKKRHRRNLQKLNKKKRKALFN